MELLDKVVAVVSDSAASQVKANRLMKFPFLPCVAHMMQLAIRDAIDDVPEIKDILTKLSTITSHFKRSAPAKRVLKSVQEKFKQEYALKQNVKTR
jgi:hypothetical protein